jgi:methyl-accepting chemotaxis protein
MLNIALVLVLGAVGGRALMSERSLLSKVEVLRHVLSAQETLSRERGPTNRSLGSDETNVAVETQALREARAASDAAMAHAIAAISKDTADSRTASQLLALRSLQDQTSRARALVDLVLAEPKSQRSFARIDLAVHGMTALIPPLSPIIAHVATNIVTADPTLAPAVSVARTAADLREYAGRIGSVFTASLVTKRPFTVSQIGEIRRLQGQVDELHHNVVEGVAVVVDTPAPGHGNHNRIDTTLAAMEQRYFGETQTLLEEVIGVGLANGGFKVTAAQFAERYVPAMGTIIDVRDAAFAEVQEAVNANIRARLVEFALVAVIGLLSIAIAARATLTLHRLVINPLLALAGQVSRLAGGDRHTPIATATQNGEIAALAAAIEDLRQSALKLSEIDAREAAIHARQTEILRKIERPLARLQAGAASLCDRSLAGAGRLAEAAARLCELGPDGSAHAAQLDDAAASARAEHRAMVLSHQRLAEAISHVRILSGRDELTVEHGALLRGHAVTLLEIVAGFSSAVGRMNLPAMAAIGAVVSDQHRLGAVALTRAMADETATTAEALGRDVGSLHGAMREMISILEQLDRSRTADADPVMSAPRSTARLPAHDTQGAGSGFGKAGELTAA